MPTRDHHAKPFDAGTHTKLSIYRSYVQAWLQVFLHSEKFLGKPLQFFDFFCGPGADSDGQPGSPLILLNELFKERDLINGRAQRLNIVFNDRDRAKIDQLIELCASKNYPWTPCFEKLDFSDAFEKYKDKIGVGPSLVFIDQNGVKHITREVFSALASRERTDFLFFTASSYKRRFGDLLAPDIDYPEGTEHADSHRVLADRYRSWAPKDMHIGHFSIKKGSNIYGLVFGSHHWLGMLKFLEVAWNLDPECGEADYEIEANCSQGFLDFTSGGAAFRMKKVEAFGRELEQLIRNGVMSTDGAVALHCIKAGILPSRCAPDVYASLKKSGVLLNTRLDQPRISKSAIKEPRHLRIANGR